MDQTSTNETKEKVTNTFTENEEKLTECFICGQIYSDPKMLPCLHTFCLKCLVRYKAQQQQQQQQQSVAVDQNHNPKYQQQPGIGDGRLPCPQCQRMFAVPADGFEALSSNIFFGRLAQQRRISTLLSTSDVEGLAAEVCVPCSEIDGGRKRSPAKFICFDCNEKLCDDCAAAHRKQKPSRHHKLAELESASAFRDDPRRLQDLIQRQTSKCEEHPNETVSLFCRDCSLPVCPRCVDLAPGGSGGGPHAGHQINPVSDVSTEARSQLDGGIQRIATRISAFRKLLASITAQRTSFIRQMEDAEGRIRQTADDYQCLLERHRDDLLQEIGSIQRNTLQELDKASVDVEFGINTMESFTDLAGELREKGTDSDVAFMWNKLETRRKQLETIHQDVKVCSVKFKANEAKTVRGNLLGKVSILDIDSSDPYVDTPSVIDIIPGSASVAGVTVLQDELYIIRDLCANVDVYNTVANYSPVRRMRLEGLRKPSDIACCPSMGSLYVSDAIGHVYSLEPEGQVLTRWQVDGEPQGLFAVAGGNVFVTCYDSRQLKEFTAEGGLVRCIRFQQDMISTWQSIPLDTGRYVVCHGYESGKLHRICFVDSTGKAVQTFGGSNGSGSGRLDSPLRIAVDPFGYVFVVDRNNDRVQLLSPNLVHVRDLISRVSFGIKQPRRIYLDSNAGCLYVGLIDGRVMIFHIIDT